MSYVFINLRADSEQDAKDAAVAAASLPEDVRFVLLAPDENGDLQWLTASDNHAFFPSGPMIVSPGVFGPDGEEIEPPEVDDRFHAILAVRPGMQAAVREVLTAVGLTYSVEMDVPVGLEVAGVKS